MFRINTNIPALPTWLEKQVNPEKTLLSSQQPAITLKKSHKQNNNSATNPETPGNISKKVHKWNREISHVQGEITAIQKEDKKLEKTARFLEGLREVFLSMEKTDSQNPEHNGNAAPVDSLRVNNSLRQIDAAISRVSARRSELESKVNNLKQSLEYLSVARENLAASESLARNADFIRESIKTAKDQIRQETSMAVMAQNNLKQQRVLGLLYDDSGK